MAVTLARRSRLAVAVKVVLAVLAAPAAQATALPMAPLVVPAVWAVVGRGSLVLAAMVVPAALAEKVLRA
jgi:hypothetical protein